MPDQPDSAAANQQAADLQPCGLPRRLLVMFYDAVAVTALLMAATAILLLTPLRDQVSFRDVTPTAIDILVWFLYLAWCWRHGGVTLGMRAWRVRLVSDTGEQPGWGQCVARFAVSLVSAASLGLGFAWSLFEPGARTWHDMASRTRLVRTTPKSGGSA